MRRWKKIALALLLLLLLSQAPFVYRRYRLGRLRATVDALNSRRAAVTNDDGFAEYKGVFHVHSFLGGHSTGTLAEVVRAARANNLDFVLMTEHPSAHTDTAAATLKGVHDGVLFVNGSEIATPDGTRLFILPGVEASAANASAPALVTKAKESGRLALVAYPEEARDLAALGEANGLEVYNLYTNSKRISYARLFFDCLWSCGPYPELLFSTFYERPADNLKRWDTTNVANGRGWVALGGNDAHANVGLALREQTGEPVFEIKLDPYERSFQVVRNHVLLDKSQPLTADSLLEALRRGRSFIAFDLFGDPAGFRFDAATDTERRVMGDEIALAPGGVRLTVSVPVEARVRLFRDGEVVHEESGVTKKELIVDRRGVYRVEVSLAQLEGFIGDRPWIISNPIYVR